MPESPPNLAICLMGPTASGKTDLALTLAQRLPVGLVSVDSAMVYRHLDIGSGKPESAVLARFPHHLVDIREPWEQYSAGEFAADARQALGAITAAGRIPLLVGGTFLYFRSLTDGLSALPAANHEVRVGLEARAAQEGWPALHAELAAVDPVAAGRIGITDRQRIQRALEVLKLTGQPISVLQGNPVAPASGRFLKIGLVASDRQRLGERITRRFARMVARGFVGEVESLLAMPGMGPDRPALRAVGYRQLAAFVRGECTRAEAENRAVIATRQLARRQLTWLRRESCDLWLDVESDSLAGDLEKAIRAAGPWMQYQP